MTKAEIVLAVIVHMFLVTPAYAQDSNTANTKEKTDNRNVNDIFKIDDDTTRDLGLPRVERGKYIDKSPSLTPPQTTYPKPEVDLGRGVKLKPTKIEVPAQDMIPYLEKKKEQ